MHRKGIFKEGKPANGCQGNPESTEARTTIIDSVFAAKANRTKMEEEPVQNVPDTEEKNDFIITSEKSSTTEVMQDSPMKNQAAEMTEKASQVTVTHDEFDLSDITATPKELSREDIIAAAEAAAFSEE